jgi:hypothetical protein
MICITCGRAACRLEADKPLLSQLLSVCHALLTHTQHWVSAAMTSERGKALAAGVVARILQRFCGWYSPYWGAAFLVDPINFIRTAQNRWVLPFSQLGLTKGTHQGLLLHVPPASRATLTQQLEKGLFSNDQLQHAKDKLAELSGGTNAAFKAEFSGLVLRGIPSQLNELVETIVDQRKELADGRVAVASAEDRISLWGHLAEQFPLTAAAAKRLLSVHVTSCSSERFWSVMGNIFTKSRNRLGIERAKMIAAIRCAKGGRPSAQDEEVCLTYEDLEEDES